MLKGAGMRCFAAGARVRLTPEASVFFRQPPFAGTVRWCREHGPRVYELTVDLDDGGVAMGLSAMFEAVPEGPEHVAA